MMGKGGWKERGCMIKRVVGSEAKLAQSWRVSHVQSRVLIVCLSRSSERALNIII
jgi:hypothetical protein